MRLTPPNQFSRNQLYKLITIITFTVVVITAPEKLITVWLGAYLEPEKIPSARVGAYLLKKGLFSRDL